MNKIIPHPYLSIVLVLSWLLLNNTIAPGHIVLGTILAIAIPWFTSSFWPEKVCSKNPKAFIKFHMIVAYDMLVANITVAKQVLGANEKLQPTFFKLPIEIKHPLGISVLASTISLTPGTVSCDLSEDKSFLLIHGLSVDDSESEIQQIKQRYEKLLMEVFAQC